MPASENAHRFPPMRLLVGFDGSGGGRDALELARTIGVPAEAKVLVIAVSPYGPLPVDFSALEDDTAKEAEPLFGEARERLPGLDVECRVFGGGSAAQVMTDIAEAEEVDLIVVGSPHRGAIGRALIGSVAEGLLHGAPSAVIVAPRGYAEERHDPFHRIAVAYDGAPESKAALARAEALAAQTNATLEILTVVAPPVAMPGVVGYVPIDPPDPNRILNEAIHSVDSGLAASGRRLDGPPARTLAEACEDGADLLVVGSRGYGPVMRVLLGSVSAQLIHLAPCPVLAVPRP
jgi:nucleotide-binding universal stress UspA family protein